MTQRLRTILLPVAMVVGALFSDFFQTLAFLTPYLIFVMLFITYCKLSVHDLKFSRLHLWLLFFQLGISCGVYGLLSWWDPIVAEGCMICVLAPTATAAAVITGMLGGNVASIATYTLISSLAVALVSPLVFALLGGNLEMEFADSMWYICKQVIPLLVFPCLLAFGLAKFVPKVHLQLKKLQVLSFYIWIFALTLVTGKTVYFILHQENPDLTKEGWMAVLAFFICLFQFGVGRYLGDRQGDAVTGGQSLGQKNTILAIWMAQVYLNPLSSIAPAAYVLWQNLMNSWQLWRKNR